MKNREMVPNNYKQDAELRQWVNKIPTIMSADKRVQESTLRCWFHFLAENVTKEKLVLRNSTKDNRHAVPGKNCCCFL